MIDAPKAKPAKHERNKFLQDNFLATASTLLAGVLGFLLQAVTSHSLHPAQYGKVFAVMGFYTLVTRPCAAFGRLQAWSTSRELSTSASENVSNLLLREQTNRLLLGGGVVTLLCIAAEPVLGRYLHVPVSDIAVGAVSIPFLLAVQPLLGVLQGEQRFIPWSILSVVVNLSRFILIIGLVLPFRSFGALAGNTLASIATFLCCLAVVWPNMKSGHSDNPRHGWHRGRFDWGPTAPFMITGLVSTFAIGVFQGADVLLVEHYFSKVPAGQYAAVAAVGSSVFFASGGVASAVFPMIAARHASGRSTLGVMGAAFGLCATSGLIGTVLIQIFGRVVLLDFAGKKYVPGDHYIGWYALGMGLLAWVIVLVNTQQSLNRLSLLWILVPATILRPLLLIIFHGTLLTVVVVSDLSVSVFALTLTIMYVYSERERFRRPLAHARRSASSAAAR